MPTPPSNALAARKSTTRSRGLQNKRHASPSLQPRRPTVVPEVVVAKLRGAHVAVPVGASEKRPKTPSTRSALEMSTSTEIVQSRTTRMPRWSSRRFNISYRCPKSLLSWHSATHHKPHVGDELGCCEAREQDLTILDNDILFGLRACVRRANIHCTQEPKITTILLWSTWSLGLTRGLFSPYTWASIKV
jgi:hypothetical protein